MKIYQLKNNISKRILFYTGNQEILSSFASFNTEIRQLFEVMSDSVIRKSFINLSH